MSADLALQQAMGLIQSHFAKQHFAFKMLLKKKKKKKVKKRTENKTLPSPKRNSVTKQWIVKQQVRNGLWGNQSRPKGLRCGQINGPGNREANGVKAFC